MGAREAGPTADLAASAVEVAAALRNRHDARGHVRQSGVGAGQGIGTGDPRRDSGGVKEVIVRFHHVGMVVQSISIADELCRERVRDDAPLVWGPVPAFQCVVAFSTRFPMIEFVVPEPESRLVKFLGGRSVLHHIAFAVDDVRRPSPFSPGDLLFDEPAPAVRGLLVNFLKPLGGLLVELVQEPKKAEGRR